METEKKHPCSKLTPQDKELLDTLFKQLREKRKQLPKTITFYLTAEYAFKLERMGCYQPFTSPHQLCKQRIMAWIDSQQEEGYGLPNPL